MKIGNITYYFPTKDDLVNALALELSALNRKIFSTPRELTITTFLETQEAVFRNHWRYRCLLLSFVHLIRQNPMIKKRYREMEKERKRQMTESISNLEARGYLKPGTSAHLDLLSGLIGLIARFWISDAAVTCDEAPADQKVKHYAGLIASVLRKYATAKGEKEINA